MIYDKNKKELKVGDLVKGFFKNSNEIGEIVYDCDYGISIRLYYPNRCILFTDEDCKWNEYEKLNKSEYYFHSIKSGWSKRNVN